MYKKFQLLLIALLALVLVCTSAMAEPRYPEKQDSVTDAAAVLSASTVSDLNKAAAKLEKAVDADLYIVTVDFLDGHTVKTYGEGLQEKWDLGDKDVLLLLAVGEDQFGLYGGRDFDRKVAPSTQQKLLSAHLQAPFMAQDYDGALRAFIPALITECAKAWKEDIDIGGLLGAPEASLTPFNAEEWLQRRVEQRTETRTVHHVTDEDEDTGISLGKVILTIFLLTVIFGKKDRRRHGRPGCGCGCMPFSSILAALGLWKLWDKD